MSKEQKLLDQIANESERSAIYQIAYADSLTPTKRILEANGILTSMLSDILEHEVKNKASKRSQEAKKRVMDLMEIVSDFSKIDDQNKQCRILLTDRLNKNVELENKIEEQEKQLEKFKQWEET